MKRIIILAVSLAALLIPASAMASGWTYHKMNRGERIGFMYDANRTGESGGSKHVCPKDKGYVASNGTRSYALYESNCRPGRVNAFLLFAEKVACPAGQVCNGLGINEWAVLAIGTSIFGERGEGTYGAPKQVVVTLEHKLF
jgi:hypothetical protein